MQQKLQEPYGPPPSLEFKKMEEMMAREDALEAGSEPGLSRFERAKAAAVAAKARAASSLRRRRRGRDEADEAQLVAEEDAGRAMATELEIIKGENAALKAQVDKLERRLEEKEKQLQEMGSSLSERALQKHRVTDELTGAATGASVGKALGGGKDGDGTNMGMAAE